MQDLEIDHRSWDGPHGTLDSIIRAQRRLKGVIISMENGRIASEYGEFPFVESSIKQNKKFPDRRTQKGDRCEFKVSDTNPPRATSIRVVIPKKELVVGGGGNQADDEAQQCSEGGVVGGSYSSFGTSGPHSLPSFDDLVYSLRHATVSCSAQPQPQQQQLQQQQHDSQQQARFQPSQVGAGSGGGLSDSPQSTPSSVAATAPSSRTLASPTPPPTSLSVSTAVAGGAGLVLGSPL